MPTVSISELEQIVWQDGTANKFELARSLDIWRIKITGAVSFSHYLTNEEIEKSNRFRNSKQRDEFVTSRGALRYLSGKYLHKAPSSLVYITGTNNKPGWEQEGGNKVHFNLAHSGEYVLIAFAHSESGIDIENIEPGFDYESILPRCFHEHERGLVKGSVNPWEAFYALWTKKEALLKATGIGIHNDLHLVPSINGTHHIDQNIIGSQANWKVISFAPGNTSAAAIAYNPEIKNICFYNLKP